MQPQDKMQETNTTTERDKCNHWKKFFEVHIFFSSEKKNATNQTDQNLKKNAPKYQEFRKVSLQRK